MGAPSKVLQMVANPNASRATSGYASPEEAQRLIQAEKDNLVLQQDKKDREARMQLPRYRASRVLNPETNPLSSTPATGADVLSSGLLARRTLLGA